jgi:AcrR family transcriptional regulator
MGEQAVEGLRARKKRQTRETIAGTAMVLFAERGFDGVTVADVARAADVSEQTVFNYFPAKEALVFDEDAEREQAIVDAVRDRPPGTSIVQPFRDVVDRFLDDFENAPTKWVRAMGIMIATSPALQRYEREMAARHARAVGAVLAAEVGSSEDDAVIMTVTHALNAVSRSVFELGWRRLEAGEALKKIVPDLRVQATKAFDLLEGGLAGFGAR